MREIMQDDVRTVTLTLKKGYKINIENVDEYRVSPKEVYISQKITILEGTDWLRDASFHIEDLDLQVVPTIKAAIGSQEFKETGKVNITIKAVVIYSPANTTGVL